MTTLHRAALSERVDGIVATVLGERRAENALEWDSLEQIEVVLAIEDEFGIHVAEPDIAGLRSTAALKTYLEGLRAPR